MARLQHTAPSRGEKQDYWASGEDLWIVGGWVDQRTLRWAAPLQPGSFLGLFCHAIIPLTKSAVTLQLPVKLLASPDVKDTRVAIIHLASETPKATQPVRVDVVEFPKGLYRSDCGGTVQQCTFLGAGAREEFSFGLESDQESKGPERSPQIDAHITRHQFHMGVVDAAFFLCPWNGATSFLGGSWQSHVASSKPLHGTRGYVLSGRNAAAARPGALRSWTVAVTSPCEVVFRVWRRIERYPERSEHGSRGKFQIVGENALSVPSAGLNVVPVPEGQQIQVQPGDVLGCHISHSYSRPAQLIGLSSGLAACSVLVPAAAEAIIAEERIAELYPAFALDTQDAVDPSDANQGLTPVLGATVCSTKCKGPPIVSSSNRRITRVVRRNRISSRWKGVLSDYAVQHSEWGSRFSSSIAHDASSISAQRALATFQWGFSGLSPAYRRHSHEQRSIIGGKWVPLHFSDTRLVFACFQSSSITAAASYDIFSGNLREFRALDAPYTQPSGSPESSLPTCCSVVAAQNPDEYDRMVLLFLSGSDDSEVTLSGFRLPPMSTTNYYAAPRLTSSLAPLAYLSRERGLLSQMLMPNPVGARASAPKAITMAPYVETEFMPLSGHEGDRRSGTTMEEPDDEVLCLCSPFEVSELLLERLALDSRSSLAHAGITPSHLSRSMQAYLTLHPSRGQLVSFAADPHHRSQNSPRGLVEREYAMGVVVYRHSTGVFTVRMLDTYSSEGGHHKYVTIKPESIVAGHPKLELMQVVQQSDSSLRGTASHLLGSGLTLSPQTGGILTKLLLDYCALLLHEDRSGGVNESVIFRYHSLLELVRSHLAFTTGSTVRREDPSNPQSFLAGHVPAQQLDTCLKGRWWRDWLSGETVARRFVGAESKEVISFRAALRVGLMVTAASTCLMEEMASPAIAHALRACRTLAEDTLCDAFEALFWPPPTSINSISQCFRQPIATSESETSSAPRSFSLRRSLGSQPKRLESAFLSPNSSTSSSRECSPTGVLDMLASSAKPESTNSSSRASGSEGTDATSPAPAIEGVIQRLCRVNHTVVRRIANSEGRLQRILANEQAGGRSTAGAAISSISQSLQDLTLHLLNNAEQSTVERVESIADLSPHALQLPERAMLEDDVLLALHSHMMLTLLRSSVKANPSKAPHLPSVTKKYVMRLYQANVRVWTHVKEAIQTQLASHREVPDEEEMRQAVDRVVYLLQRTEASVVSQCLFHLIQALKGTADQQTGSHGEDDDLGSPNLHSPASTPKVRTSGSMRTFVERLVDTWLESHSRESRNAATHSANQDDPLREAPSVLRVILHETLQFLMLFSGLQQALSSCRTYPTAAYAVSRIDRIITNVRSWVGAPVTMVINQLLQIPSGIPLRVWAFAPPGTVAKRIFARGTTTEQRRLMLKSLEWLQNSAFADALSATGSMLHAEPKESLPVSPQLQGATWRAFLACVIAGSLSSTSVSTDSKSGGADALPWEARVDWHALVPIVAAGTSTTATAEDIVRATAAVVATAPVLVGHWAVALQSIARATEGKRNARAKSVFRLGWGNSYFNRAERASFAALLHHSGMCYPTLRSFLWITAHLCTEMVPEIREATRGSMEEAAEDFEAKVPEPLSRSQSTTLQAVSSGKQQLPGATPNDLTIKTPTPTPTPTFRGESPAAATPPATARSLLSRAASRSIGDSPRPRRSATELNGRARTLGSRSTRVSAIPKGNVYSAVGEKFQESLSPLVLRTAVWSRGLRHWVRQVAVDLRNAGYEVTQQSSSGGGGTTPGGSEGMVAITEELCDRVSTDVETRARLLLRFPTRKLRQSPPVAAPAKVSPRCTGLTRFRAVAWGVIAGNRLLKGAGRSASQAHAVFQYILHGGALEEKTQGTNFEEPGTKEPGESHISNIMLAVRKQSDWWSSRWTLSHQLLEWILRSYQVSPATSPSPEGPTSVSLFLVPFLKGLLVEGEQIDAAWSELTGPSPSPFAISMKQRGLALFRSLLWGMEPPEALVNLALNTLHSLQGVIHKSCRVFKEQRPADDSQGDPQSLHALAATELVLLDIASAQHSCPREDNEVSKEASCSVGVVPSFWAWVERLRSARGEASPGARKLAALARWHLYTIATSFALQYQHTKKRTSPDRIKQGFASALSTTNRSLPPSLPSDSLKEAIMSTVYPTSSIESVLHSFGLSLAAALWQASLTARAMWKDTLVAEPTASDWEDYARVLEEIHLYLVIITDVWQMKEQPGKWEKSSKGGKSNVWHLTLSSPLTLPMLVGSAVEALKLLEKTMLHATAIRSVPTLTGNTEVLHCIVGCTQLIASLNIPLLDTLLRTSTVGSGGSSDPYGTAVSAWVEGSWSTATRASLSTVAIPRTVISLLYDTLLSLSQWRVTVDVQETSPSVPAVSREFLQSWEHLVHSATCWSQRLLRRICRGWNLDPTVWGNEDAASYRTEGRRSNHTAATARARGWRRSAVEFLADIIRRFGAAAAEKKLAQQALLCVRLLGEGFGDTTVFARSLQRIADFPVLTLDELNTPMSPSSPYPSQAAASRNTMTPILNTLSTSSPPKRMSLARASPVLVPAKPPSGRDMWEPRKAVHQTSWQALPHTPPLTWFEGVEEGPWCQQPGTSHAAGSGGSADDILATAVRCLLYSSTLPRKAAATLRLEAYKGIVHLVKCMGAGPVVLASLTPGGEAAPQSGIDESILPRWSSILSQGSEAASALHRLCFPPALSTDAIAKDSTGLSIGFARTVPESPRWQITYDQSSRTGGASFGHLNSLYHVQREYTQPPIRMLLDSLALKSYMKCLEASKLISKTVIAPLITSWKKSIPWLTYEVHPLYRQPGSRSQEPATKGNPVWPHSLVFDNIDRLVYAPEQPVPGLHEGVKTSSETWRVQGYVVGRDEPMPQSPGIEARAPVDARKAVLVVVPAESVHTLVQDTPDEEEKSSSQGAHPGWKGAVSGDVSRLWENYRPIPTLTSGIPISNGYDENMQRELRQSSDSGTGQSSSLNQFLDERDVHAPLPTTNAPFLPWGNVVHCRGSELLTTVQAIKQAGASMVFVSWRRRKDVGHFLPGKRTAPAPEEHGGLRVNVDQDNETWMNEALGASCQAHVETLKTKFRAFLKPVLGPAGCNVAIVPPLEGQAIESCFTASGLHPFHWSAGLRQGDIVDAREPFTGSWVPAVVSCVAPSPFSHWVRVSFPGLPRSTRRWVETIPDTALGVYYNAAALASDASHDSRERMISDWGMKQGWVMASALPLIPVEYKLSCLLRAQSACLRRTDPALVSTPPEVQGSQREMAFLARSIATEGAAGMEGGGFDPATIVAFSNTCRRIRYGPNDIAPPGWMTSWYRNDNGSNVLAQEPGRVDMDRLLPPLFTHNMASSSLIAWRQQLEKGVEIDAMDDHHRWFPARVLGRRQGRVLLRFLGWCTSSNPGR